MELGLVESLSRSLNLSFRALASVPFRAQDLAHAHYGPSLGVVQSNSSNRAKG